jgi:metal-responsive CopG/Arc/MetJ family transcriptional regulator
MQSKAGAAIQVRLSGSEFHSLENWRRTQSKIPPRSEAIREAIRRFVKQQPQIQRYGAQPIGKNCP